MTKETDPLVCRARFVSDSVPVLLLLNAEVIVSSGTTERIVPLAQLYREDGLRHHQLARGEFLRSIQIPNQPKSKIVYEKLRIRNAIDFPSLGLAGRLARNLGGSEGDMQVRLALTGVGMSPALFTQEIDGSIDIEKHGGILADQIKKIAKPLEQDFFPTGYRRLMISVMVRRVLEKLSLE
jgi:CO/xanthine dehydrogenase FAD-binding subunit